MLRRTLLLIALSIPALSHGAIYQCKVDGRTIFSDQPCGDDAKELDIEPPPTTGSSMVSDQASDFLDHRQKKRRLELIGRDIERLEDKREVVRRNMDEALVRFQQQKARANNNLAGAVWENSLAEEAQVLTKRYQSEIDQINRDIDRLYGDRRHILGND